MPYEEEMVSADPGPEAVPAPAARSGQDNADAPRPPVMAGLEEAADDPRTAEPIEPAPLVGEEPAKGSVPDPG